MNNFISVINRKFALSFKEDFDEQDYLLINRMVFGKEVISNFQKFSDREDTSAIHNIRRMMVMV